MKDKRIIILAGKGVTSNIVYNALKDIYTIDAIVFENPVPRSTLIKKRVKKLGLGKVVGQIFFQIFIVKWLDLFSRKRKRQIIKKYQMDTSPPPKEKIVLVNSINDHQTIDLLQSIAPDLVVVNGTRIISQRVLDCIPVKFINTHAGITPKYRNVHGAYWANVNNDLANCGVTVHLVDKGIDTGSVIYQERIRIEKKDNFVTYPLLQIAKGIECLKKAIDDIFADRLVLRKGTKESGLWYHPTFLQYIYHRTIHAKK